MIEVMEIKVYAVPAGQPRARATVMNGHARVHQVVRVKKSDGTYKDHPSVVVKSQLRQEAGRAMNGRALLTGPLRVDIEAVFPRPQKLIWKTRPMIRLRHTSKPDRDNLDKLIMDALNKVVWNDDCQVCAGEIEKWIADGKESPFIRVRIYEVD